MPGETEETRRRFNAPVSRPSPSKYKLDTEYAKGGSVRKQRRLAKRGWGVTKRK